MDLYRQMDFPTRDSYRHAVEAFARHARFTESDVAERAVRLAEAGAAGNGREDRRAHVGYYLMGAGRIELETAPRERGCDSGQIGA